MKQLLAVAGCALAFSAFGHGGEDHGAPAPAVSQAVAPRAVASSAEFEAVIVLEGQRLVLYLDDFSSNAPVVGAKVEIEGAGLQGVAVESTPGVYAMVAALTPARHALTIAIETADSADLLLATLDIAAPSPVVEPVHGWSEWLNGSVAGVLVLAGGLLWVLRRRKPAKGGK